MNRFQRSFSFLLLFVPFVVTGCFEQPYSISTVKPQTLSSGTSGTLSPTPTPAAVCNSLGGSGSGSSVNNGLKAQMYYFDDAELATKLPTKVSDFYNFGKLSAADFYFNNVFVPGRDFTAGFQLKDGTLLKKADGTTLFEYFGFRFKSQIKLAAGSAAKKMQFALLADDGANLLVQNPTTKVWSTSVNNDGTHQELLACGSSYVQISADTPVSIELQYYQGPRTRIALVLMWREWKGDGSDSNCAYGGDDTFARPDSNRWTVVPSDVFFIEAGAVNPCQ